MSRANRTTLTVTLSARDAKQLALMLRLHSVEAQEATRRGLDQPCRTDEERARADVVRRSWARASRKAAALAASFEQQANLALVGWHTPGQRVA